MKLFRAVHGSDQPLQPPPEELFHRRTSIRLGRELNPPTRFPLAADQAPPGSLRGASRKASGRDVFPLTHTPHRRPDLSAGVSVQTAARPHGHVADIAVSDAGDARERDLSPLIHGVPHLDKEAMHGVAHDVRVATAAPRRAPTRAVDDGFDLFGGHVTVAGAVAAAAADRDRTRKRGRPVEDGMRDDSSVLDDSTTAVSGVTVQSHAVVVPAATSHVTSTRQVPSAAAAALHVVPSSDAVTTTSTSVATVQHLRRSHAPVVPSLLATAASTQSAAAGSAPRITAAMLVSVGSSGELNDRRRPHITMPAAAAVMAGQISTASASAMPRILSAMGSRSAMNDQFHLLSSHQRSPHVETTHTTAPTSDAAPGIDPVEVGFDRTLWVATNVVARGHNSGTGASVFDPDGGLTPVRSATSSATVLQRGPPSTATPNAIAVAASRSPHGTTRPRNAVAVATLKSIFACFNNAGSTRAALAQFIGAVASPVSSTHTLISMCWAPVGNRANPSQLLAVVFALRRRRRTLVVAPTIDASGHPLQRAASPSSSTAGERSAPLNVEEWDHIVLPLAAADVVAEAAGRPQRHVTDVVSTSRASAATVDVITIQDDGDDGGDNRTQLYEQPTRVECWRALRAVLSTAPSVPKIVYDAKSAIYALLRCPSYTARGHSDLTASATTASTSITASARLISTWPAFGASALTSATVGGAESNGELLFNYLWCPTVAAYCLNPDSFAQGHAIPPAGSLCLRAIRGIADETHSGNVSVGSAEVATGSVGTSPAATADSVKRQLPTLAMLAAAYRVAVPDRQGINRHALCEHLALLEATADALHAELVEAGIAPAFVLQVRGLLRPSYLHARSLHAMPSPYNFVTRVFQEMPLVPVVASMEVAGIAFNAAPFSDAARKLRQRITALEEQVSSLTDKSTTCPPSYELK